MTWIWQKVDWPEFRWETARLALAEKEFLNRVHGNLLALLAQMLHGAREFAPG